MDKPPLDKKQEIIMRLLKFARKGEVKPKLMHKIGLSFTQFDRYLTALKKADFMRESFGVFTTTEKGVHAIEACELCHCLMKEK